MSHKVLPALEVGQTSTFICLLDPQNLFPGILWASKMKQKRAHLEIPQVQGPHLV